MNTDEFMTKFGQLETELQKNYKLFRESTNKDLCSEYIKQCRQLSKQELDLLQQWEV